MASMSRSQQKFNDDIDGLLAICRLRGISSEHLRAPLHKVCINGIDEGTQFHDQELARIEDLTAAGLSAQLSFLLKARGIRDLKQFLERTGGVLDAIVLHTSSSPKQLEEDIGRNNIDADGYVV